MSVLKVFFLVAYFGWVLSERDLLKPCHTTDIDCLSQSTEQFLEQTHRGIPQYDIRPIDPLIIPALNYNVNDDGDLILHFKNINITGLRNQKISEFKMDLSSNSVILTTRGDLNIGGDITSEFTKISKSFSGTFTIQGSALGTAQYNYNFKKDDNGVEHFEVGPEHVTCQPEGEPKVIVSYELRLAIDNEPEAKKLTQKYSSQRSELHKKVLCKIVSVAYASVVHNIRAAAKLLPKTAFFTNI